MIAAVADEPGVVINNIGPIEHLELAAKPGTITVLRGNNGSGKSTALDAISALTRGGTGLESRDGTVGGTASGFGVQIKVGRGGANRRTGDLIVTAVEDRLSIADFVDPPVKDPVAADSRRLKALVGLVGLVAKPEMFHELVGGPEQFAAIVKPETLKETDPITLAEKIKRDLESASRLANTKAERLYGDIQAKQSASKDVDLTAECDRDVLQKRLERAIGDQSSLKERQNAAGRAALQRQQAKTALKKATDGYTGMSSIEAEKDVTCATEDRDSQQRVVQKLEDALREAKADLQTANSTLALAVKALEHAKSHEASIAAWRETLQSDTVEAPSENVLAAAEQDVQAARTASENGTLIRAAKARLAEADELDVQRKAAVVQSERLRDAAKSVLDVLAAGVKELVPGLQINNEFRIVVPHPIRTSCYYADLSHGERWKMALDIAVNSFERRGERGVLSIPQEAWEGLDGINRQLIAEHVASTDLIVFTAESCKSIEEGAELAAEVLS